MSAPPERQRIRIGRKLLEIFIVGVLITLNGLFALSELAVVSSRPARLRALQESGRSGASAALALAADPGRFLSTVQIGITLVGILAGAFSGAALGGRLADFLAYQGVDPGWAVPAGYGLVIAIITYLSVIVGELIPKHLALRDPEAIACMVAPTMRLLSRLAAPLVSLLDGSTRLVFRLFGQDTATPRRVTDEEIRSMVAEAESAGVIESGERRMIAGVMRLGDRSVRGIMTPRTEVETIDVNADATTAAALLRAAPYSVVPVTDGSIDNIIGVVRTHDVFSALLADGRPDIRQNLRPATVMPDTLDAIDVVESLRSAETPMALIHDEYGHFEGVVTPADALKAIVGDFRSDAALDEPDAVRRPDGSWLISGGMPADEMADLLRLKLPEDRDYETAAGFLIELLQRLPGVGESAESGGWRFEVVDLDGLRIDKILASPVAAPPVEAGD